MLLLTNPIKNIDMKRIYLSVLITFLGVSLLGQNASVRPFDVTKNHSILRNDFSSDEKNDFKQQNTAAPFTQQSIYDENMIFTTAYDLQSAGSLSNRLIMWDDETMAAVATFGIDFTAFPDRGTAYNYFNGSTWNAIPVSRIESIRSAFPSIAKLGANGEIIVSHHTEGDGGTAVYTRENKGQGIWNEKGTLQNPAEKMVTWPRIASGGDNNNYLYVIGTYQYPNSSGIKNEVYFNRSTNGGETWSGYSYPPLVDVEGLYNYIIKPDSYSIATNGSNVAILFAGLWHDLFYLKSTDNGETWQKKIIWEHPYPSFDYTSTIMTDTLYTVDNSASITIDNNGNVHVAWGVTRVGHWQSGTNYSWTPTVNGIGYWNETMEPIQVNENPHKTMSPEHLEDIGLLIGWCPDVDGDGVVNLSDYEIKNYRSLGAATLPAITINSQGVIAVAFSAINETRESENVYFRDVYVSYYDPQNGWDYVAECLSSSYFHLVEDAFFVTTTPNFADHPVFMFSGDNFPGTAVDGDHSYLDNITYVVRCNNPVSIEETTPQVPILSVYPNPVSGDCVYIDVTAKQTINNGSITLYTVLGQPVLQQIFALQNGKNQIELNTSQLQSGVYFCVFDNNGIKETKRIIIQ